MIGTHPIAPNIIPSKVGKYLNIWRSGYILFQHSQNRNEDI